MDLSQIKKIMKDKKITQSMLSEQSGIPLHTLKCILIGRTKYPRIDTVQAIEKALGLDKEVSRSLSKEEKELIELIKQLNNEETKELSSFVDFIISKRK